MSHYATVCGRFRRQGKGYSMDDQVKPQAAPYEPPTLCKQDRLEEVAEGSSSSTFTSGYRYTSTTTD